jgi:glycosyltransferase involved in cell wall biosynthesis
MQEEGTKIVIDWGLSSYYGWGVHGLNLALELSKRGIVAMTSAAINPADIVVDPLRLRTLAPFIDRSNALQKEDMHDAVLMTALGNDLSGKRTKAPIGVAVFEKPLSKFGILHATQYDLIVTGSSWNEELLRSRGITHVKTLMQGVDRTLFHPAPRRGLFPGRFLIFSGGKSEPRKGQDIVVKAFRIFARKHPEAMLVTAWHSPWPHLSEEMDLDLSEFGSRVVDVGPVPNGAMAPIYRECDVALFPNRAEGGTNLVAMECIACGVPTILSDRTGHRDLLRHSAARPIRSMRESEEPDLGEILDALQNIFDGGKWDTGHTIPEWSLTLEGLIAAARQFGRKLAG